MHDDTDLVQPLLKAISDRQVELDEGMVRRAFDYSAHAHRDQKRKSGEPYLKHPVAVATILVELLEKRTDAPILAAALLHDVVEDTGNAVEDLKREFGEEVAALVDGVTKIAGLPFESIESEQAENFRKMMLSMSRDVRVILIKLADRLHNMRTLEHLSADRRLAIAQETRDIYAPLAHRLGIGRLKWELEDLALKFVDPDTYRNIASLISERREGREALLVRIIAPVADALQKEGIPADILGRVKHFDSIYRKIVQRHVPFDAMHDLFGVRIVTHQNHKADCYRALGVLHDIYKPVPDRFKDYIATPKANMYQSLHTTVIGPDGRSVEFQIRTREMHRIAEFGIAAHYTYKEGSKPDQELDEKLGGLLGGTLELDQKPEDYLDFLRTSLYQDEVFVFTPKGDLRRFPQGATALDFAFLIHTDVGLHTVGARVGGRLVPLRYELKNGDVLEVVTQPGAHPSEFWLSFLKTSRARAKVRHWLKEQRREDSINLGREMLGRELKRNRKKLPGDKDLIDAAQSLGVESVEALFASIGQGDLSALQVATRIFPELGQKRKKAPAMPAMIRGRGKGRGIQVQGVSNLMLRFSKCCSPVPGDQIVGVVTRGRGMSVHRVDCPNAFEEVVGADRRVDLSWDVPEEQDFIVKLVVMGEDRPGMLADVANAITSTGTNVTEAGMRGVDGEAVGTFLVQIKNLNQLNKVTTTVRKVRGVRDVERATLAGEDDA